MGIALSDPMAPTPTWRDVGARAARGAGLGLGAAAALVIISLASRRATLVASPFTPGLLVVGLVVSLLTAARDELLLRGVTLRATRGLLPGWARLLACGAAAAAARWGLHGVLGVGLVAEALRGAALGGLWVRDRGGWMAIAANAAWTWVLGAVIRGGILDVRSTGDIDGGLLATAVLALAAGSAALWSLRPTSPTTS
jgi:hypothetical protein